MRFIEKIALGIAITACGLAAAVQAADPAYPTKIVKLVVPYPPGGSTDILGRIVAEKLTQRLGQTMIVENRPGAGGMMGSDVVAKSAPDGYTVLVGSVANTIHPYIYKNMPFDLKRDLTPVAHLAAVPNFLVVNAQSPVKSVADLIAMAKAKPGSLTFASTGAGATPHLSGEALNLMAGIKMIHVPYKGSGPALVDVMSGQVTAMFDNSALPHIRSGRLRGLAVSTAKRTSSAPEIPTMAESGVPGFDITSWYGVWVPTGTPAYITKRLHKEISEIIALPEVQERLKTLGAEPVVSTQAEYAAFVTAQMEKWRRLVEESGIKVDQ